MKSWLTGSGLLWSETSSSLLFLLQVPDRRRTEAPSWCETSGWDVHARGDKAGSARLSLTLPLFISLITVTWKMTCWKNVFIWRPRSRYGLRAPSPPASSWRWRTASWKFTFMNWQWTRWVETKVSLFVLLLFFNTPSFLVCVKKKKKAHSALHLLHSFCTCVCSAGRWGQEIWRPCLLRGY